MFRNVIMLFPKITNGPRAHGDLGVHRNHPMIHRDNVIVRLVYSCCSEFLTIIHIRAQMYDFTDFDTCARLAIESLL